MLSLSEPEKNRRELEAEHIYLLMKKDYRLSRNIRAQWFFNHLNSTVSVKKKYSLAEYVDELEVISVIPRNPPIDWNVVSSDEFEYRVTPTTLITFLSHRYRLVFCLDLSPSVAVVDIQRGEILLDEVSRTLEKCLSALSKPFYVPGSQFLFQPQLYVSVIAHIPFSNSQTQQVLAQGWLVTHDNCDAFLEYIQNRLLVVEDSLAEVIQNSYDLKYHEKAKTRDTSVNGVHEDSLNPSPTPTPDTDFVTLLRYGILSLQLLPENTSAGIVVVTDGVISMPDVNTFDSVLAQLRCSTIACSFLQLGSPYHPHCCLGFVPYPDLMQFIATATCGAYFSHLPAAQTVGSQMNVYHRAFFAWSFQWASRNFKLESEKKSTEWGSRNFYFHFNEELPLFRKKHLESNIHTSLTSVLSCRLREGHMMKDVVLKDNNHIKVTLMLPWKHNVNIEYTVTSLWPANPANQSCHYEVVIEGPYNFLCDFTYPVKKPFRSFNRNAVIKKFWSILHGLSQTDQLLVHLHSFANNPANYTIPESIKSGIPLFSLSANCTTPHLYTSDVAQPQFQAFWKPICMLDINIWQKWMHSHRIGVILEHDHPLPKYLQLPTPSGRYHIIQCRQGMAAVHNLLTEWSSFVLVENHSYIKFLYSELEKPPTSFYVIRVTSKPPCMVIRLAFLGGTHGSERNQILTQLREKILSLTFPQRPVVKDSLVRKGLVSSVVDREETDVKSPLQRGMSQINCCVLLMKPLDKILYWYEKVPSDFFNTPPPYNVSAYVIPRSPTVGGQKPPFNCLATLHRYLHHSRWVWAVQNGSSCPITLNAVARVLSTLVKIRLHEGFHIAHSISGILNMVLEVEMKNAIAPDCNGVEEADEPYYCVVQYILFPPHSTTTSIRESISEDDIDNEVDTSETNGELQLITECWIEPQTGVVTNSPVERKHFDGLAYKELSQKFFPSDKECIATMVTFEYISLLCQNPTAPPPVMNSPHPCVSSFVTQYVPFAFDLMRLLPKCHQTELLFSTYIEDLNYSQPELPSNLGEINGIFDIDAPNKLLMELLFENLARTSDREIYLTEEDSQQFPRQLTRRDRDVRAHPFPFHSCHVVPDGDDEGTKERYTIGSGCSFHRPWGNSGGGDTRIPRWKCFVKGITGTHVLLTFIPASFSDLKALALGNQNVDKLPGDTPGVRLFQDDGESEFEMPTPNQNSVSDFYTNLSGFGQETMTVFQSSQETLIEDPLGNTDSYLVQSKRSPVYGSVILPVYVYDCPLSGLISRLIYTEDNQGFKDAFLDQTFKTKLELGEDTVTLHSDTQSSEDSKHASPEPRSEESSGSPDKVQVKQHCNDLEIIFSKCFVVGVFRSLHLNHRIHNFDVQSAVDGICEESLLEIDITNFIQTVCGHIREFKIKTALEYIRWSATQQNRNKSDAGQLELDFPDNERLSQNQQHQHQKFPVSILQLGPQCDGIIALHSLIKNKFSSILKKSFISVPSNPDFFFYCPPSFQRTRSKLELMADIGSEMASPSDDDQETQTFISETVEFRSEHGSTSFFSNKKTGTDEILTDQEAGTHAEAGSQISLVSNVDSESMGSIMNGDLDANDDNDDNVPPLFIHLTCTVRARTNLGNCSVRCIPTCLNEIVNCFDNPVSEVDLSDLQVTLDITCLTLPPNLESRLSGKSQPIRTTSFCSVSPIPTDTGPTFTNSNNNHSVHSSSEDDYPSETQGDQLSHLPDFQHRAVTNSVEEIKWMLRDEIASSMLESFPLTEATLDMVASHVQSSPGRPGCVVEEVPLQFVFGADHSLDKFIQEFRQMSLTGYHLNQEGDYYYLVLNRSSSLKRSFDAQPVSFFPPSKFFVVQPMIPHADDQTELSQIKATAGELEMTSDDGRLMRASISLINDASSAEGRKSPRRSKLAEVGKQDSVTGDDTEAEEMRYTARTETRVRKLSRVSKEKVDSTTSSPKANKETCKPTDAETSDVEVVSSANTVDVCMGIQVDLEQQQMECEPDLVQSCLSSQLSEKKVELEERVEKLANWNRDANQRHGSGTSASMRGVNSCVSSLVGSGQCSNTEDGYDGDSSDVDNEGDWMNDFDTHHPLLPKFWLILKVFSDRVNVYFHTRDTDETDEQLQHWKDVCRQVIKNISNICKIVNQTLLLQDLHDTRMCNQLLEPEASEDIWKQDDRSTMSQTKLGSHRAADDHDVDSSSDYHDSYLKANMDFMPGAFACKVVWQTHFILHPRLKTGPGRTGVSRGIRALRTVLNSFSVNNRENMFVYAQNSGSVFYLRLNESQCPAQGSFSFGPDSTPGSRSSSMIALPVKRPALDLEDDFVEQRPRVNSMSDRCHELYDTASVASRTSTGRQKMEDSIQLVIHGIAEAGPAIKEDLVQVLQNRLDEAVLDVISVTLSRNPMCKLTVEDVQFIQKPNEQPKSVIQFTVHAHALPYLQAVGCYLRQNLLQFLNTPKFIDSKAESHFQDYNPGATDSRPLKEGDAFLYNRPQGSGSKGIALIAFSLVDGQGNAVQHVSCPRPSPTAYKDVLSEFEFETLTSTAQYVAGCGKHPGPMALIQFRIWERGKLDLEQLTKMLMGAVRHSLWDVVMEYRLLTAPLAEAPSAEETVVCSEPATPIKEMRSKSVGGAPWFPRFPVDLKKVVRAAESASKERAPSPLTLVQVKFRELSSSVPDLIVKSRSPVTSPKDSSSAFKGSPSVPSTPQPSTRKEPEVQMGIDADVLRRQEKYELGDKGKLHPVYSYTMKGWIDFGVSIGVPSVSKPTFSLTSRYALDLVLREFQTIVTNLVADTTPKAFRKVTIDKEDCYIPHTISVSATSMPRERKPDQYSPDDIRSFMRPLPGMTTSYIIVGRDVKQWRTSISYLGDEPTSDITPYQVHRLNQKFSPVIQSTGQSDKMESSCFQSLLSNSTPASATTPGAVSVGSTSSLLITLDSNVVYIPRQRLLLVTVADKEICMYTYNWSLDQAATLVKNTTRLIQWHNARSCLLTSLVMQKMGLFHYQALGRVIPKSRLPNEKETAATNPFLQSGNESATDLFKYTAPPNRDIQGGLPQPRRPSSAMSNFSFLDVFRDTKPPRPMHKTPYNYLKDPVLKHGHQMQDVRNSDRKEQQKKLSVILQPTGGHGNVSFTEESLHLLRQVSRIEHYCLTPLLFMPQWRWQVALARDHTMTPSQVSDFVESTPSHSRHSSGSSVKGFDLKSRRQSINLPIMQPAQNSPKGATHHRSFNEDMWHAPLCASYIQEFIQYLQSLGFVTLQTRLTTFRKLKDEEDVRTVGRLPLLSRAANSIKSPTVYYVQKSLLGSLIVLELAITEPYFGVRMYAVEGNHLLTVQQRGPRPSNSQLTMTFVDECDKLKVLIHLHSFTYDYHLRSIHSYISGRQLIFRQGYHLTSFLDDFVKYYQKSPNFAWNLIYQGNLSVECTNTPATQLYNHLLAHDKSYGMQVLRMIPVMQDDKEADNEYVLVQLTTQKVSYQDVNEIRRTDDFDVSLLVSHNANGSPTSAELEKNVLVLKYYIVLTSRRELYPRVLIEKKLGKFRTVATATPISSRKVSLVSMDKPDVDKLDIPASRKTSFSSSERGPDTEQLDMGDSFKEESLLESSSAPTSSTPTIHLEPDRRDSASDSESILVSQTLGVVASRTHLGIRQESVNYLGYFSTTEELMNKIMMKEAQLAKERLEEILATAIVHCRRDSLWKRLLVGVRDGDDGRRRRDESKDVLSLGVAFTEFTELLSLVTVQPLSHVDAQLAPFLNMHISWYQGLVKVLTTKYVEAHRHFVSSDGTTQHVVVLNHNYLDTFMLLSVQSHLCKASLSAVYREVPCTLEHTPERPNFHAQAIKLLIEDFVNTCCFHLWSCIL